MPAGAPTSPSPPTILFVAGPRGMGGSNRSLAELLEALGPSFTRVLASPPSGDFYDHVTTNRLIEEHISLPLGARFYKLGFLAAQLRIAAWAIRHRAEVSAIHANATTGVGLALLACLFTRIPVVAWIHDPMTSAIRRALLPLARPLLRRTRWAAVSGVAARVVAEYGIVDRSAVVIIPNPIDRSRILAETLPPGAETIVGFLGGTSARKGFDLLPEMVARLADQPISWRLYLETRGRLPASERQTLEELRRFDENRVQILPRQPDVRKVYGACHLVFVPSRNESFCRVVAEAMANGMPVVAFDIEPIRDLLGDDEAGVLVPVGDTAGAAEAIAHISADSQLAMRLGQAGRVRSEPFDPARVAGLMAELYAIEAHPSGRRSTGS